MKTTATDAAWPRASLAWSVVFLLAITYCLSFIDRYMLTLLVQPVKADLGLSDTQIGLVTGLAFGLFYATAGVPMGMMADRVSRRLLIAGGVFLWSAMTALSGLAGNFSTLFVSRMGLGLGEAVLIPAGVSLIADYFPPERRGRAISLFMVGASVGSGLAIVVGGTVVGLTRDLGASVLPLIGSVRAWQLAFLAIGVPGMIFALVFLLVPEPARRGLAGGEVGSAAAPEAPRLGAFLRRHRRLLALHIGGMSLGSACTYGFAAWSPTLLIRVFGWSAEQVGYLYGPVVLVASATGMMTGGAIADRRIARGDALGGLKVMIVGLAALAITVPLSTQLGDAYATLAMLGVVTFVIAVPYGVSMTALMSITPNALRGKISAIYMFCISTAGFGLGATFVGWASDRFFSGSDGIRDAIALLSVLTAPAGCLALVLMVRPYRRALTALERAT